MKVFDVFQAYVDDEESIELLDDVDQVDLEGEQVHETGSPRFASGNASSVRSPRVENDELVHF